MDGAFGGFRVGDGSCDPEGGFKRPSRALLDFPLEALVTVGFAGRSMIGATAGVR